ncbi:MAG: DUF192 domain-containing protein [Deltaproteobacteria bacterium]|nr:DUF192 domain-containing protein [Deltaproteobacteria bacterium]
MGRAGWGEIDGLLIDPCDGVHTFFVRFPLEVVFLDEGDRVVAVERLEPWRVGGIHAEARRALELPWGTVERTGILQGQTLLFGLAASSELTRGMGDG